MAGQLQGCHDHLADSSDYSEHHDHHKNYQDYQVGVLNTAVLVDPVLEQYALICVLLDPVILSPYTLKR